MCIVWIERLTSGAKLEYHGVPNGGIGPLEPTTQLEHRTSNSIAESYGRLRR